MNGQIRQGDILLIPSEHIQPPEGLQSTGEVILAYGEVTGHAHRLKAVEILEWSVDGQRYVHVKGAALGELSHEDHDATPAAVVEPGLTYQIIQQKEWDLRNQWRKVDD